MEEHVAVIGTGRMGAAMAGRLVGAGFPVVVWNRTPATAEAVAAASGARTAPTAARAAAEAEVVVASLADDEAVLAAHLGEDGTIEGCRRGTVLIETSTVDPATIQRLSGPARSAGVGLLDAPVSGSVSLVEQGSVTSMVGGADTDLDRARPVLEAVSKAVFHLGASGSGATMKLAVNALVHATNLALSEALVLAETAGIERASAYEVFASGAGGSPFVHYKREAFAHPDAAPVAFSIDLMAKDLDLILSLARRLGVPMRQGEVTADVTASAVAAGMGQQDMSALAVLLRERSGTA